ncbi:hypothetical protein P154DRAFT_619538 [Amniculicola lignicola CBS 123094]|uniref:Extracellular membrane protein CFEM domain-containing protein n=1 Tax=Amniculicola lignicola CBS 123094 TaxID=1392246 RepID=A0A6A5WHA1_9PLEO|nr:hypothetical protein P154DRAFT_619538 [Amniculicola lignicola CBS 123094]
MKYSAIILSFALGAFAIPQASTITSAPASVVSANLTPEQSCATACPPGDVNCQAGCFHVAHPNSSQVVETNECAAKCDQGNGSPEDTQKFSDCVQTCINKYYPSSQTYTVPAGSAAPSNAASVTGAQASGASAVSGTGSKPTGSGSSATAASSSTSTPGAAAVNSVQVAGASFFGLVMAIFAL